MNNNAALGYMIAAAQEVGLSREMIEKLEDEMRFSFDGMDEEEAERVYKDF